eukprot:TRINITY_DN16642_c0_g1_i1.p1 TRINITY_DN16642_c0_g1~~TRINITY_DN16642_c0_g1_i1.p1  ORF type:complete len:756 (+),score=154.35 TRINITY_DN16642_c0_g1_i1:64-2268(+)
MSQNIMSMFKKAAAKKAPPKRVVVEKDNESTESASASPPAKKAKRVHIEPEKPELEETPTNWWNKFDGIPLEPYMDVSSIDTKDLPVALNHAKLLQKCKEKPPSWKAGQEVPYYHLCDTLAEISSIGSRLEVSTLMTECFMTVINHSPDTLLETVYMSLNKLAPEVEGLELGIGDAFLIKCISATGCLTEQQIKVKYKKEGDLAEIAQFTKSNQRLLVKPKDLTVRAVFKMLKSVAMAKGKEVQKRRIDMISRIMRDAKPIEANFLIRALQGKMRIGLAENTVLMALSHAFAYLENDLSNMDLPQAQWLANSAQERMRRSFNEMPSFDKLVPALLSGGLRSLSHVTLMLNLPVKPMLAKPMKGIKMVLKRFSEGDFTCEYKYDGERAQVHYTRTPGSINIFSRNSENHTPKYPDIIKMLKEEPIVHTDVTSFILDSEVVAFDRKEGKIQPFQALQHRPRKDVRLEEIETNVCIYAFDLLYLNGESLLDKTFKERRELLQCSFNAIPGLFQYATKKDCTDADEIEAFLNESIKGSCEGLMVKTLTTNSEYTPSRRTFNWLKLKKDYLDGVGDTLDLVPIGAWHGKGKRTGVFAAYLLACYEPDAEVYQAICKVGTGFKDEDLTSLTDSLSAHVIHAAPSYFTYGASELPDVWFSPQHVWEVKAADLSISPKHQAAMGLVHAAKGIALRFPRFIRIREDKGTTDATTCYQVADMYNAQFQGEENGAEAEDADDDNY